MTTPAFRRYRDSGAVHGPWVKSEVLRGSRHVFSQRGFAGSGADSEIDLRPDRRRPLVSSGRFPDGDTVLRARSTRSPRRENVPILGAKLLAPTPGPFHLVRPRLHDRLKNSLEGRATIVMAGPGYGKTSLMGRFAQEIDGDLIWYSLDSSDRDPWMFFRYLIHGIKEHVPEFGERSEGLWKDPRPPSDQFERMVDLLVSEAEENLEDRLVVVLDEIHSLESSELCTRAIRRLLAYLPGALHLVLVGRSIPDIGAKALVADGSVHVLRGEDLLFTLEETRTLLVETFGLPLATEAVHRVHARTRGWVTALQLLRQTARLRKDAAALPDEIFARTEAEIFDYFSEEVFASEASDVRDFLLDSSPPDFIDPDICTEVLASSDVRPILDTLLARKLFLSPLESQSEYYAYDPLFRDFLRRKLREKGSDRKRALDGLYGKAFAKRGSFPEALSHWIAAEDPESVVDLLRRHGHSLLRAGALDAIVEAARFAARQGDRSPVVEDLLGEASRLNGDYAAAAGHFERALASGAATSDARLSGSDRANTLQGLAYCLLKQGEPARAATIAEKALQEAGDEDLALVARILNTLSIIRYRENRLEEAVKGWQEALARARQADDHHLVLMIAHNLGLPHAVMGDFQRASECFQILTGADNTRIGSPEGAAYLNLARIATIRGEFERAASYLGDAREIARKCKLQSLTADTLEAEGNLLRESGEFDAAGETYARARSLFTELGQQDVVSNLDEEMAILAARRGEFEEAERLGAGVVSHARSSEDRDGLASSLLALGEIRVRANDAEAAVEPLVESAALFDSLGRAYQTCSANLWLSLARLRTDARAEAETAGTRALKLAARFDYRAPVLRVAALDERLLRLLSSLPAAPAFLRRESSREEAAAVLKPVSLSAQAADLTVRLLGPVEVFRDEARKIPASAWKIKRALEMFCYLAHSRNHRATKDRLVDVLWGNARPSVIEKNFHPTISYLRRALNHGHRVTKSFLVFERGAYLLNPEYRYAIDAETFEEKVRSARGKTTRGENGEALQDYDTALALYRGPFMEEDYTEWTEAPRSHYEELYLAALVESAELHIKAGSPDRGIALLKSVSDLQPLDEPASCRLMRAFALRGDRRAVEKEYQRLGHALQQELRARPMPETQRTYLRSLEAAAQTPANPAPGRESGGGAPRDQPPSDRPGRGPRRS